MDSQETSRVSHDFGNSYKLRIRKLSYKVTLQNDHPSCFSWKLIKPTRNPKYILQNVNMEANPGELTAIAGPSGAGKTTLLETLSGNIVPSRISGEILVNDQPMNVPHFRRISGYVTQHEALFPLLTVEESLSYSALLRLGGRKKDIMDKVKILIKELGLEHVSRTRIGDETHRGISGGEKRRVSIGVDLVHDPSVLLIDEPTSGLDSGSALHVMKMLSSMAKIQGKTILVTIHQPGFRILELIDRIVLLYDGFVIQDGPLSLLEDQLKCCGNIVPQRVNLLEFAIEFAETLHMEEGDIEICEGTEEPKDNRLEISSFPDFNEENNMSYPNSSFKELIILSQRTSKNIFRSRQLLTSKIVQVLLAAVLLGTLFLNTDNDQKLALQTRVGFFAVCLGFLFLSSTEVLPIFLLDRRILKRETTRGAYRTSSYVIANTVIFVPFLLAMAIIFSTPIYFLVGLKRDISSYLYFCLVVWMVFLMANSFVACLAALVPNITVGAPLIAALQGSFFLFSGYFIAKNDIPKYWMFMHYLSLFKYPFECLMINDYGEKERMWRCLKISDEGLCLMNADQFLLQEGVMDKTRWNNIVVMLGFIIVYRLLSFLILNIKMKKG